MFADPDLHSNKQIRSLDDEHVDLLNNFLRKHGVNKRINRKYSDVDNFRYLKSKDDKEKSELYTSREMFFEIERAKNRAAEIFNYIKKYDQQFIDSIIRKKKISILDLGSGNGLIAKHLAILFQNCVADLDMIDLFVKEVHVPYEPKISRFMCYFAAYKI